MLGIQKYITKKLFFTTLFILSVLTLIFWLALSLKFIDFIILYDLPISVVFKFLGLLFPLIIYNILPFVVLIACVFTYNQFINDRELIIFKTVGLSPSTIAKPALMVSGFFLIIAYSLSLYFVPLSNQQFKGLQHDIEREWASYLIKEKEFITVAPYVTVYIEERISNSEFAGFLLQDERNYKKHQTLIAKKAIFNPIDGKHQLTLIDGFRHERDMVSGNVTQLRFDQYTHVFEGFGELAPGKVRSADERFIGELFNPTDVEFGSRNFKKLRIAGHQRIVQPLYVMIFVLIALMILLTGQFSRHGQTKRLVALAAFIAIAEGFIVGLKNVTVHNHELIPLIYIFPALVAIISIIVLLRARVTNI